jgi:MSHA biogenesis protein MshG
MSHYTWRGRNTRGEAVDGLLLGQSQKDVADQLMTIGITPIDIVLTPPPMIDELNRWVISLNRKPVTKQDVLLFSRQMYTLSKAGVPLFRALSGLQASATTPAMADLIKDLRTSLDQGQELSAALAQHPKIFDPYYVAMCKVGEMTGRLSEIFLRLNEHLEFEREIRERIRQAMRYPSFVVISLAIALVLVNIFVIPVFAKVFAGYNAELPLITRGLLGFSAWMMAWWPLLLVGLGASIFATKRYLATALGRQQWDRFKLRLPIVGDIVLKATLARFTRSFALASQSGVPLLQSLTIVAMTADNTYVGGRILLMRDGIQRGESIARCAAVAGVFTPVVLQMIDVGEETGELDSLLFEIASMYERETSYSIKGLSAAIEPLLLGVISILVLLLALGIYTPMWNMGQAAMGRGGG